MNYQGRLTRFELSCYDANSQTLELNYPGDLITPGELKYRALASKHEMDLKRKDKIIADLVQENKYSNRTINNMSHKIDKLEDWRQQDQNEMDHLKYDFNNQSNLVHDAGNVMRYLYDLVEILKQKNNSLTDKLGFLTQESGEWIERCSNALADSTTKDIELVSLKKELEQQKTMIEELIKEKEVLVNEKELQENKFKELCNENKELETVDQLQENKIGVLEITNRELRTERQLLENKNGVLVIKNKKLYDMSEMLLDQLKRVSNRMNKISILRKNAKQTKREVKELMEKYRQLRSDNRTVRMNYKQQKQRLKAYIKYLKFQIYRLKRSIAMTKIKRRFHAKPLKRRHRKAK